MGEPENQPLGNLLNLGQLGEESKTFCPGTSRGLGSYHKLA